MSGNVMKLIGAGAIVCGLANLLYGCGGGGGGSGTTNSSHPTVAAAVTNSAPASQCPNGGITVNTGIDTNGNSVLDSSEIQNTQYVCNGTAGSDGASGAAGSNGATTLVLMVDEAAGSNCTNGGKKITSGPDTNGNGVLDAAEVTATAYVCNGAPAGITWVDVTGTAIQATSNTGYLADNASTRVTVTLPANPAVGDVVRVNGLGAAGWQIAQNAGQSVQANSLAVQAGTTWTARDSVRYWQGVASSADGSKLVATDNGLGQIYTSSDSGLTWTARDSARNWLSVASSADGSKLVAVVQYGQIYTSTDSGVTWTPRDAVRGWAGVASSADGSKLVATESGGQIYTSSDSGVTWTPRDSVRNWMGVASSADGSKLVATAINDQIYTSADSGVSWIARDFARTWTCVASSADGNKLVAADFYGQIYTSTSIQTSVGTAGAILGSQYGAMELQFLGNSTFDVLSSAGSFDVR